ncbi:MAG: ATP-binding protein [Bdellovibrio sp.]
MFLSRLKPTLLRISTKLALAHSLVLIFSSTVLFGFLYFQIKDTLADQEIKSLQVKLEDFNRFIETGGYVKLQEYYERLPNYYRDSDIWLGVITPSEDLIFSHEPATALSVNINLLKDEAINQSAQSFNFTLYAPDKNIPVQVLGYSLKDGNRLVLAKEQYDLANRMNSIHNIFWLLLIPLTIIGFLGGLFLSNKTLSPVHDLLTSMKKVEGGSLSTRVPIGKGHNELEELKVLCNKMLDKIESLVNGLKEAFDHLAHDIRTPVTRLRGRAELALMAEADLETYREALQSCYENSDKILSFLQLLTDITEAENRSKKLKLEKKYISDLVREVMSLYEMAFEDKEITVIQKLDTNDWALVDSRLISRVIANLLDNAHKYTPEGGEVTIETINQTENVILRVTDTGPGIAPEEHSMIWQKLYRSDKSRSEYGMGLGLTFVKAVVEAHDGKVSVRSPVKNGRGTEFEVLLQKMS